MPEFDTQTLLNLTAGLAHNLAAATSRRAGWPDWGEAALAPYEQQLVRALAPGLVAFVSRLSAGLPTGYDARPVLARFCADPATVAALERFATGEAGGLDAVAQVLLAAGLPAGVLDPAALAEALVAWSYASAEVARLDAASGSFYQAAVPLYQTVPAQPPGALAEAMIGLVHALAKDGLSFIDGGHVIAADGYTILFAWRGQSAGRDEPAAVVGPETHEPPPTPALPPSEPPAEPPIPLPSIEPDTPQPAPAPPLPLPPLPIEPTAPPPLPEPTAPGPRPPAPAVDEVIALRLDVAAPPQVTTGLPFDLAAAILRAGSPPLAPDDLTQVESAGFAAIRPAGAAFISLRIQVAAPDCDIHNGDTRPVRLLAGQDGPTVYFQLTPRRAGSLSIIVTVYQDTDWIGSTRLRTEAGAGAAAMGAGVAARAAADAAPRAGLVMNVVSQSLGETQVNLKMLRDALDDAYSDAELRDLCFELEIDYEDLPGDGQSAKARELVMYCKRRGLLAALVACVMRDRPLSITN